jgi:hypothetical protein
VAEVNATPEEAARVVADLVAAAEAQAETAAGRRAAQNFYNAAATVELTYGIGNFQP